MVVVKTTLLMQVVCWIDVGFYCYLYYSLVAPFVYLSIAVNGLCCVGHGHLGMGLTSGVVLSLLLLQGIASIRRLFTVIACMVLMSYLYDSIITGGIYTWHRGQRTR